MKREHKWFLRFRAGCCSLTCALFSGVAGRCNRDIKPLIHLPTLNRNVRALSNHSPSPTMARNLQKEDANAKDNSSPFWASDVRCWEERLPSSLEIRPSLTFPLSPLFPVRNGKMGEVWKLHSAAGATGDGTCDRFKPSLSGMWGFKVRKLRFWLTISLFLPIGMGFFSDSVPCDWDFLCYRTHQLFKTSLRELQSLQSFLEGRVVCRILRKVRCKIFIFCSARIRALRLIQKFPALNSPPHTHTHTPTHLWNLYFHSLPSGRRVESKTAASASVSRKALIPEQVFL